MPDATPLERALVALVRKSRTAPARLVPADLDPVRAVVGDGALDYALVVATFHFVNRIADLLHVEPEVLPAPLRRFEPLRRATVRVASLLMRRMDLRPRRYATGWEAAVAPFGRAAQALLPLRPRPKLVEAIRLRVEERGRSSLDARTRARVAAAVEAALPASEEEAEGFHARPHDPVEAFAFVGTRYPARTTDATIALLHRSGFDDLAILDLAIAVADANQWARLHRLVGVPAEPFYAATSADVPR